MSAGAKLTGSALFAARAAVGVVRLEVNTFARANVQTCLTRQQACTVGADLTVGTLGSTLATIETIELHVDTNAVAVA